MVARRRKQNSLFHQFINHNLSKNWVLDFGGSNIETVARFYKSFGAKDYIYLQVKQNNLPKLVSWIKKTKS